MIEYSVTGHTMTLSETTTAAWDSDGPTHDETRREVLRDAAIVARSLGGSIDVYTSDGIMLEHVHAS